MPLASWPLLLCRCNEHSELLEDIQHADFAQEVLIAFDFKTLPVTGSAAAVRATEESLAVELHRFADAPLHVIFNFKLLCIGFSTTVSTLTDEKFAHHELICTVVLHNEDKDHAEWAYCTQKTSDLCQEIKCPISAPVEVFKVRWQFKSDGCLEWARIRHLSIEGAYDFETSFFNRWPRANTKRKVI